MGQWADLAMQFASEALETETPYTVTSPSFDEVPAMTEETVKQWIDKLINEQKDPTMRKIVEHTLNDFTTQELCKIWYEKDGRIETRQTYQTNVPPK